MTAETLEGIDEGRLLDVLARTWPAAAEDDAAAPGWRIREGAGGGKRVSAALSRGATDPAPLAEALRRHGRAPLVMVPDSDAPLDAALAAAGWEVVDPTVLYAGDAAALAALPMAKGVRWAEVEARLVLLEEVWDAGGVGPARRAVMDRAAEPKTVVMARTDMAVAGLGFVAVDGEVAMLHAVEIRPEHRRRGGGRAVLAGAARFALRHGARVLALAVTEVNAPARALYENAGMSAVGGYRYRRAPDGP